MTLREAERRRRQAEERDRALDDQRVMTLRQWCEVNGFSWDTGRRLIKAGKAPSSRKSVIAASASPSAITAAGSSRASGHDAPCPPETLTAIDVSPVRNGTELHSDPVPDARP
jgi:hypothetical protein